jgi:hypothetical protein
MFGSKKRLRERLETEGVRAPAVVVRAEPTTTTHGPPTGGIIDRKWKLTLKVQPPGQPAFDVEMAEYFRPAAPPNEGSTMDVFFNSADHREVCIDLASLVSAAPSTSVAEDANAAAVSRELQNWSVRNPPSMRKQWKMRGQLRALQMTEAREGRDGKMFIQSAGATLSSEDDGPKDPQEQLAQLEALRARGELTESQYKVAKRFLGG